MHWRQARVLGAGRVVPSSGLEDEAVPVEIALDNRGQRGALFTEILDDFGPALADRQALLEPGPLPGGRRRHLRYRTACSRRWGIYTVGPLRLTTGDPFGLFRVVVHLAPPAPFAVFPRLVEMTALFRLGGAPSLAPQERAEARAGQGALVLGVRDYRSGDDVRRMHWPAFARRGFPRCASWNAISFRTSRCSSTSPSATARARASSPRSNTSCAPRPPCSGRPRGAATSPSSLRRGRRRRSSRPGAGPRTSRTRSTS